MASESTATPFKPTNAAKSFARTTTAGKFREDDESRGRMRITMHPAQPFKPAPQPQGRGGCVDLERVNARLLEIIRKKRAEKEKEEMKEKIAAKAAMKAEQRTLEKLAAGREGGEKPAAPGGWRAGVVGRQKERTESHPSAYNHGCIFPADVPRLRASQSANTLMRTTTALYPVMANVPPEPSRTMSSSPWSLLNSAQTRISFPPLSPSLSSQNANPEQQRRGSYDRPDWSESDETSRRGLGVTAGLRLLVKKPEGVLRRRGSGKGVDREVQRLEVVPERRVVMRMQNDSVVSTQVGWRCGCFMK